MPVATFPKKLYQMLEDAEVQGFTSIISWLPPDQKAFKVHDKDTFEDEIMPRYFQHTKYKSFIRQLNLWSFQRIQRGPKAGGYFHMYFMKSNQTLAESMLRSTPTHRLTEQECKAVGKKFSMMSPRGSTSTLTSDEDANKDTSTILTPLLVAHSNLEPKMEEDGGDDLQGKTTFNLKDSSNGCQRYRAPKEAISDVLEATTQVTNSNDHSLSSLHKT